MEIDESEEIERMTLLKQRETLIRGMGKTTTKIYVKELFVYLRCCRYVSSTIIRNTGYNGECTNRK
jgi:hypothetical protein